MSCSHTRLLFTLYSLGLTVTLVLSGCRSKEDETQVQRVLYKATPVGTPVATFKSKGGKQAPRQQKPTPSKASVAKQEAALQKKESVKNIKQPTPAATSSVNDRRASSRVERGVSLVTTHTLGLVCPDIPSTYRIEGSGLGECHVYLRRYGVETELIPSQRTETLLEFRDARWLFLESGAYDLIVRDPRGQEWEFPEAVRVP